MTAVDTNVLVYAHRQDSPWNGAATSCLIRLAEGTALWAIPWPCIHEFLAIVTHPRIFPVPTPMEKALHDVQIWMESPSLRMIGEGPRYWEHLCATVRKGAIRGPLIHDAKIAAICREHGVTRLLSADRDFSRFPVVEVKNSLLD